MVYLLLVAMLLSVSPLTAAPQHATKDAPNWKEYVYSAVGFAITLPHDPNPHTDASMPDMTAYTVHLSQLDGLTLRVSSTPRDCTATLKQLKNAGKPPQVIPGSVKQVTVGGHPGIEWKYEQANFERYERYVCANGRFYIFTATWMGTQDLPREFTRIVNSLRFLPPATKQKP